MPVFIFYAKIKNMLKDFAEKHKEDIILTIGVILISLLSFAMGYIVAKQQEKEPLRFEEKTSISNLEFFS